LVIFSMLFYPYIQIPIPIFNLTQSHLVLG
jgi:hypothetical protein